MLFNSRSKKDNLLTMRTWPRCDSGLGREVEPVANLLYLATRGLGNVTCGWATSLKLKKLPEIQRNSVSTSLSRILPTLQNTNAGLMQVLLTPTSRHRVYRVGKHSQEGKGREGVHVETIVGLWLAVLSTFEQSEFFVWYGLCQSSQPKVKFMLPQKVGPKALSLHLSTTPAWDGCGR